jgi:hypothetical protein
MPIALIGKSGTAADVDGTTFRANKITRRGVNYECYGQYQLSSQTSELAAALAAAAQVFQFGWGDPDCAALITYISLSVQPMVAFTANTLTDFGFEGRRYRGVTAVGSGGTVLLATGNWAKTRTSMGSSRAQDVRIATTAALGALTGQDSNSFCSSIGLFQRVNPTAGVTEEQYQNIPGLEFQPRVTRGEMPVLLVANESIALRNRGVWPAAGTARLAITIRWSEFEKTRY